MKDEKLSEKAQRNASVEEALSCYMATIAEHSNLPHLLGVRSKAPSGCLKLQMVLSPYIYHVFFLSIHTYRKANMTVVPII